MLTITAKRHEIQGSSNSREGESYSTLAMDRYEVRYGIDRVEIQLFRGRENDPYYLHVGPKEDFAVAFVSNATGKTIDTIKV